ncbi:adhesion G protein-coupled receptor E1-like [Mytilus californianus]|uniref:adhesion G protein-coupled receptor E1-like n=1 Tax=Mytilus californianus TaxID=6549 RepID=UPI002245A5AF|nr:adhesion G protein-coupled receptor E1-like [Mytilus californianus]
MIYLQNNLITTVNGTLQGLTSLSYVYLQNNLITTVNGTFEGLTSLRYLYLENNLITTVNGTFEGLTSLRYLYLENNQITTIQHGSFQGLTSLYTLHLENNQVTTIQHGSFQGLTYLYTLYLENNQITTIQNGSFQGLTYLYTLHLQNNQITTIQQGSFKDLPSLGKLHLEYNNISVIENNAFIDMSTGLILYLDGNNIDGIDGGIFGEQKTLQEISLQNNSFKTVKQETFAGYYTVNKMSLQLCSIEMLEIGAFREVKDIYIMHLEDNKLTEIKIGIFLYQYLPFLTELKLSRNQLTFLKEKTFDNLQNLKYLYLDKNEIGHIEKDAFENLVRLELLDLKNNNFAVIESSMFRGIRNCLEIDLRGNNLTFVKNDTFRYTFDLNTLYLELVCDCTNVPFWSWWKSSSNFGSVTCLDRNNFRLSSLQTSVFDNCTCTCYKSCFHDFCSNGGSCSQNSYGDLICSCVGNWTGGTCTETSCPPDYCSNGGSCSTNSYGDLICLCNGHWTGATCTDSPNLCEENMDNFHTNWSITTESTLAILACTGEYTGNVSRYCSSDGKWEKPNYSNCISKSIQHIKEQTAELSSGASDYNNVTIILKDLENITRNNNELRSGDLFTSSSILNDIAKYVTNHTDTLSVDQLEIFASLCNNLLDERNRQPWEELIDEGSGGVTSLVNAVTGFNDAFNDVIDSNFSLVAVKENVVMEVGKASSDEITVPDRLKTSDSWISDSGTEIKLKLKQNICGGLTGYSSTFYRNVSRLFPEYLVLNGKIESFNGSYDVNSIIADFTIHGTSCSDYSLIIRFDHLLGKYTRPFCGHWDFNATNTRNGAWSSFGSRVVDAADSYTICEYNHTTNFAILMSPGKTPLPHHFPLSLISAIGCGVSILFLVITIIIHVVFWRDVSRDMSRNMISDVSADGPKTLMNLCVALILSYVIFLAGITQTENEIVCSVIAIALHYMFLTDFALMLAEGIIYVKMVVFMFNQNSVVHLLIPACWIVPAGIVGISAGVTKLKGYGNQQFCWLTPETNLIWAFIGPALFVILINVIVIIIVLYKTMTVQAVAAKTPKEKSKIGLKGIRVMLPLFGVMWILGTFSLNDDLVMFQYLFAIFNSLQGLFIFVFNCCLTDKVRKGYREYQRRRANRMDLKLSTECTTNDNPKTADERQNPCTEEIDERI